MSRYRPTAIESAAADEREADVRRKADAARRFLGARTVEEQMQEQVQAIHQLRADLTESRDQLARMLSENMRLMQQNDALLWSLEMAHKHYVIRATTKEA